MRELGRSTKGETQGTERDADGGEEGALGNDGEGGGRPREGVLL